MSNDAPNTVQYSSNGSDGTEWIDLALGFARYWKWLLLGPLVMGVAALGTTFLMPNVFTSRTVVVPPQQQQSSAAIALSQLGGLASLSGIAGGLKSPADQYVALIKSDSIADRLIDEFKLMQVYDVEYRFKARDELANNVRVTLGKKDGLIAIEVDDESPQRAADIANGYVRELRRLTGELALTEAQQRRTFFEVQLAQTRDRLTRAQETLQASGFSQGVLRADARASAERYARLAAEATAAEVRLQTLRRNLADSTPEVQQATSTLGALRAQLAKLEAAPDSNAAPDYIGKFREFKYQETLFELMARQYELARIDESREGVLIQVVDEAKPAEWKSKPKRALVTLGAALGTLVLLLCAAVVHHGWRETTRQPHSAAKLAELRSALRRD
jgi:uncharacterized protein involved in exopolysaccharide biosynthesis